MTQLMTEQGMVRVPAGTWVVDPGSPDRDEHLTGPNFFDAEHHPEITYASTRIESVGGPDYRVTGDLTIKGVTRPVTMEASVEGAGEDPWGAERVGIRVRGKLDRKDFGLTWQQPLAKGGVLVGEEVKILIDVSAVRAS
jgi:polyisoprenoid-binding protein YceI